MSAPVAPYSGLEPEALARLERLVAAPGAPGREGPIRSAIRQMLEEDGGLDTLDVDPLGSLIGTRAARPAAPSDAPARKLLIAAHMDQVGFLVSHVSKEGFLRLHPLGAFDPACLVSQRVRVLASDGADRLGVLMPEGAPLHIAGETGERVTLRHLRQFFVDLGKPADADACNVRKGDMVVFDAPLCKVGGAVCGAGLDDRVGCWALVEALRTLNTHACDLHFVWSAQEELGSRGIEPAAARLGADLALCCEAIVAADLPGTLEEQQVARLGDGPALLVADYSMLSDPDLLVEVEAIGTRAGLPYQRALMEGGGQDGALIQRSGRGVRTLTVSCPIRYMHSTNELADISDLVAYRDLIARALEEL